MGYPDAIRAIIARFQTNYFETDISIGDDGYEPSGATAEYVRLWVLTGSAANAALGAGIASGPGYVQHPGTINVQIFVRPRAGQIRLAEIAELISDVFQNTNFDDVKCYETSLIFANDRTPDGWIQANAITVFTFDERKAA